MRILLVEDDQVLGEGTRRGLIQAGYTVDWVQDGTSADQALQNDKNEKFDLIILDLGIPKMPGLTVLKNMRARGDVSPVLVLTARETIEDRVTGLDTGADDYLVKPADLSELLARARSLLRRSAERATPLLVHNDIIIDPASHNVTYKGELINLTRREFALLHVLLENAGRVLSREHLTQSLYGWGEEVDSNALEVHVHNLRKRFGQDFIRTVRGIGYVVEKSKDDK